MPEADDEILEGYQDGRDDDRDEMPASLANRSALYQFGWLNGRDDRRHRPRKPTWKLRIELAELEASYAAGGF